MDIRIPQHMYMHISQLSIVNIVSLLPSKILKMQAFIY